MERADLGFLMSRLLRDLARRERPTLDRAGLDMWGYVVLVALEAGQAPTQAELAALTGRDQTRLIGNLDALEQRGLVDRARDPSDRRRRIVSLTDQGRRVVSRCRSEIAAMEDDLLAVVDDADRAAFERVLVTLVGDAAFGEG